MGYSPWSCIGSDTSERVTHLHCFTPQEGCPVQTQLQGPAWSQDWSYQENSTLGEARGRGSWAREMRRRDGNSFLTPPPIPPAGLVASFPGEPGALAPLAAPSTSALPAPTTLKPQGKLWKNCGSWPQGCRPPGGPAHVPTFPAPLDRPTAPPETPQSPLLPRHLGGEQLPPPRTPTPPGMNVPGGRKPCPPSQGARVPGCQTRKEAGYETGGNWGPGPRYCSRVPGQVSPHLFKQQIQRNCEELKLAACLHSWGKS